MWNKKRKCRIPEIRGDDIPVLIGCLSLDSGGVGCPVDIFRGPTIPDGFFNPDMRGVVIPVPMVLFGVVREWISPVDCDTFFSDFPTVAMFEPFFRFSDVDSRLSEFNPFRLLGKDDVESLRNASLLFSRRGVLRNISSLFSRVIIRICSSLLPPPLVLLSLFREGERDVTELFGFIINDLFVPAIAERVSCALTVECFLSLLLLPFLFVDALGNVEQRVDRGVDGDWEPAVRGATRPLFSGLFKPVLVAVLSGFFTTDEVEFLALLGRAMPDEGARNPDCFGAGIDFWAEQEKTN